MTRVLDNSIGTETPMLLPLRRRAARHEFEAWLPDDLVALKTGSFVSHESARVRRISRDCLRLRIGRKRLFGTGPDYPVDVTIRFERNPEASTAMTRVIVDVRPLVFFVGKKALWSRYQRLVRSVRACFMAGELENERQSYYEP